MKKALVAVGIALLAGCANQPEEYKGQGEYFELVNVNIIERDLSVFKPTQIAFTPEKPVVQKPKPKVSKKVEPVFVVRKGERYQVALKRWVRKKGYPSIAWSMDELHSAALDVASDKRLTFKGSLKKAVDKLSDELEVPIKVVVNNQYKVAGVYDFEDKARITHVNGQSLKVVTQRVVENYGLKWVDGGSNKRSWLVATDYEFSADYFLLTAEDDIQTALANILEGYPVYSSILESTGQVFIQEEQ